uniref:DUF711 family protein n=1 Tax=Palpitomonas bilix TaxID=652834 RepID=A0A7S3DDE2_9EUKA|mmetsp:Transcript_32857/g.84858  ORF Transcript_32857/g.84858 Transcript_32857/m.84858 type:complete len:402 (+) Transcript_32857:246-1451(+)|eukprot:CAMPEP_0113890658 /NCGR_PEP_ID=MMETSP0780_2-20120614/14271_1 /TAXON_ID=652834 /ORGANISM="Palpitomonas bilix" /LENGTH=401 /DNA_ID=CAMNT_0000880085 /DNA_START=182 /DNA_END=1387 /DNA_ORIENTATION=- /assembly_acc=CAM_ASM_000599
MKIRTVTVAFTPSDSEEEMREQFSAAQSLLSEAKAGLEGDGWEVQTTRCVINSEWVFAGDVAAVRTRLHSVKMCAEQSGISFLSLGSAKTREHIAMVPSILSMSPCFNLSAKVGRGSTRADFDVCASAMVDAFEQQGVSGNFRFCVCSGNCDGIAFFPAADHSSPHPLLLVGFENGDVVLSTAKEVAEKQGKVRDSAAFSARLCSALTSRLPSVRSKLEEVIAHHIQTRPAFRCQFGGFDLSVAPSVEEEGSIGAAVEAVVGVPFGRAGTLAGCEAITRALKQAREESGEKIVGYSGLMLPVCEDVRLAKRAKEGCYDIQKLLSFSSVCGCGLDTVPLSLSSAEGGSAVDGMSRILHDMAAMSYRCNKPLSVRFLLSHSQPGTPTSFDSPYLVNSTFFELC